MSTHGNIYFLDGFINDILEDAKELNKNLIRYLEEQINIFIYWDGYPDHIIPILIKFLSLQGSTKRKDINYLRAWFITYYCITVKTKYLNKNLDVANYKNYEFKQSDFNLLDDFSGVGICQGFNNNEFLYIICPVASNKYNYNIFCFDSSNKLINKWSC